jgi:hypothetical protein
MRSFFLLTRDVNSEVVMAFESQHDFGQQAVVQLADLFTEENKAQIHALLQHMESTAKCPSCQEKSMAMDAEYQLAKSTRAIRTLVKYLSKHSMDESKLDCIPKRQPSDRLQLFERDWSDWIQSCSITVEMLQCWDELKNAPAAAPPIEDATEDRQFKLRKPLAFVDALACAVGYILDSLTDTQKAAFERAKQLKGSSEIQEFVRELGNILEKAEEVLEAKEKKDWEDQLAKIKAGDE